MCSASVARTCGEVPCEERRQEAAKARSLPTTRDRHILEGEDRPYTTRAGKQGQMDESK